MQPEFANIWFEIDKASLELLVELLTDALPDALPLN